MNREAIYSAIYALVPDGFTTVGRKLKAYDELKPEQYPALFQTQNDEEFKAQPNLPGVLTGGVKWWLYVYTDPSIDQVPAQVMNPLLDAVQTALSAQPMDRLTLGGLVDQCYIDGTIQTDEGYLQDYSVAIVPIRFVTGGG